MPLRRRVLGVEVEAEAGEGEGEGEEVEMIGSEERMVLGGLEGVENKEVGAALLDMLCCCRLSFQSGELQRGEVCTVIAIWLGHARCFFRTCHRSSCRNGWTSK